MFKDLTVKINKKYLEDYNLLSNYKNKQRSPFQIRKDVFLSAMTYGYLEKKSKSVKNPHDLFRTSTFTIEDQIILKVLYLKYNNMEFDSNYTDENVIKQAMEWAEAGFQYLKLDTIEEQGSNFECLLDLAIN